MEWFLGTFGKARRLPTVAYFVFCFRFFLFRGRSRAHVRVSGPVPLHYSLCLFVITCEIAKNLDGLDTGHTHTYKKARKCCLSAVLLSRGFGKTNVIGECSS